MKKTIFILALLVLAFTSVCSADIYTKRMSNLGAERFVQEYNSATYNNHGKMNYFVKPELATPSHWKNSWPYNLWRTKSIDGKYTLEVTVDKQGYVTKAEIICAFKSDLNNALKILNDMLYTGSFMSGNQIEYLMRNIKYQNGYSNSDITISNQTRIVFLHHDGSLSVYVLGASPYD